MRPGSPISGVWLVPTSRRRNSVIARSSTGYHWGRRRAPAATTSGRATRTKTPPTTSHGRGAACDDPGWSAAPLSVSDGAVPLDGAAGIRTGDMAAEYRNGPSQAAEDARRRTRRRIGPALTCPPRGAAGSRRRVADRADGVVARAAAGAAAGRPLDTAAGGRGGGRPARPRSGLAPTRSAHGRGIHARLPRARAGGRGAQPRLPAPLRTGKPVGA